VKRGDGTLRVHVSCTQPFGSGSTTDGVWHDDISAVGIGHIRKDVVLVPADETLPVIEAGTDWTRLIIEKREK
jgi:hypothetical protein